MNNCRGLSAAGTSASHRAAGSGGGQLWVEKYRPKNMTELVGNNSVIANLKQWLQTWCALHMAHLFALFLSNTLASQR